MDIELFGSYYVGPNKSAQIYPKSGHAVTHDLECLHLISESLVQVLATVSSFLLMCLGVALAQPSPGCCNYLGSEPANGNFSLSLSLCVSHQSINHL